MAPSSPGSRPRPPGGLRPALTPAPGDAHRQRRGAGSNKPRSPRFQGIAKLLSPVFTAGGARQGHAPGDGRISPLVRRIRSRYFAESNPRSGEDQMPRRLAAMLVIASALLFTAAPPGAAAGNRPEPTTFVNSLNAPPETVFSDRNLLAWFPIWAEQSLGPKFTLSQPTVLAHVGAFVTAYPPKYPAEGGSPFR